jgi:hypothetical protein
MKRTINIKIDKLFGGEISINPKQTKKEMERLSNKLTKKMIKIISKAIS